MEERQQMRNGESLLPPPRGVKRDKYR
jgi:hypothetical protein